MGTQDAYGVYRKVNMSTAPQSRLIIMMYEGAIRFLEAASTAMDKKYGTEEAHNNILKAQDIIYELLASLNYEAGDIANRLAAIYTYMNQRLTEANISKQKAPIVEVSKYLKELKVAWEGAEANMSRIQTDVSTPKSDPPIPNATKPSPTKEQSAKSPSARNQGADGKLNISG